MDLLARAGLPVPEGFVLTREIHRDFLGVSGIAEELRASQGWNGGQDALLSRDEPQTHLAQELLARLVRDAVLDLGARTVTVLSEDVRRSGLGSLPEVLLAVRQAWLSEEGLRRQAATTAGGGEIPTWPVLVQRELHSEFTGWSTTDDLREESGHPARKTHRERITLHDIEPAHAARSRYTSIARLTREAGSVLGEPVQLEWGLREGQWYVLSATRQSPEGRMR